MPATRPGPKPKYPWPKWLTPGVHVLVRGRDYDCQPHGLVSQFRKRAADAGCELSVEIYNDVITVIVTRSK